MRRYLWGMTSSKQGSEKRRVEKPGAFIASAVLFLLSARQRVQRDMIEADQSEQRRQRRLFSRYMDEENYLTSLHLRHIFRETLQIIHKFSLSHYIGSLLEQQEGITLFANIR